MMYDFVIHMFLFLGALFGSLFFALAIPTVLIVILHELFAMVTLRYSNPDNEENHS